MDSSVFISTTILNVFADREYIGIITRYDSTQNELYYIVNEDEDTRNINYCFFESKINRHNLCHFHKVESKLNQSKNNYLRPKYATCETDYEDHIIMIQFVETIHD